MEKWSLNGRLHFPPLNACWRTRLTNSNICFIIVPWPMCEAFRCPISTIYLLKLWSTVYFSFHGYFQQLQYLYPTEIFWLALFCNSRRPAFFKTHFMTFTCFLFFSLCLTRRLQALALPSPLSVVKQQQTRNDVCVYVSVCGCVGCVCVCVVERERDLWLIEKVNRSVYLIAGSINTKSNVIKKAFSQKCLWVLAA